jgi:hypothetical protein
MESSDPLLKINQQITIDNFQSVNKEACRFQDLHEWRMIRMNKEKEGVTS